MGLPHLFTHKDSPVRHARVEPPQEARKEHHHQEIPVHPTLLYRSTPKTRDPPKRLPPLSCRANTSRGLGPTHLTKKSRAIHSPHYGPALHRILTTSGYLRLGTSQANTRSVLGPRSTLIQPHTMYSNSRLLAWKSLMRDTLGMIS